MWLTLQQPRSSDYIIASGKPPRVRDFSQIAFNYVGLKANDFVFQDQTIKKIERIPFIGDSTKIRNECNWSPKISFRDLVIEMVERHIKRLTTLHQTPRDQ